MQHWGVPAVAAAPSPQLSLGNHIHFDLVNAGSAPRSTRELSVRRKLNAMAAVFEGKRVLLVDDSIVRGTTMSQIVDMVRKAGASKVRAHADTQHETGFQGYLRDTLGFLGVFVYDPAQHNIVPGCGHCAEWVRAHTSAVARHGRCAQG